MPSPQLRIRRIVVEGKLGLDLTFDAGVNVLYAEPPRAGIRFTNKAGKTALVELIQHGLGVRQGTREEFHFAPIADQIDTLWLEVEINGQVLTIQRSLRELGARVALREYAYTAGIEASPADLVAVEDVSQLFLRKLDIPEVFVPKGDEGLEPLSFPNLMRGFILHQDDSFGALIGKMPPRRRTDILGFLTGVKPVEAFRHEEEVGLLRQKAAELRSRYESVWRFLQANGVPSPETAQSLVTEAEARLADATAARRAIQEAIRDQADAQSAAMPGRIDLLRKELLALSSQRAEAERESSGLVHESERLASLVASLRTDLQRSKRTQSSATILSTVEFSACPRCLLEITPEMRRREEYSRCGLCNRPLRTTSDAPPRLVPRAADIQLQLLEAHDVLADVRNEASTLASRIETMRRRETELGRAVEMESRAFVSPALDEFLAVVRVVSEVESELSRARTFLEQSRAAEAIRVELDDTVREINELEEKREQRREGSRSRLQRLREIYRQVLTNVDFPALRAVSIDGKTLMPKINGELYVHSGAAFRGLAITCYHLALLHLSLEVETYFPRLLVIDSPAVGDLNDENHDDLLNYIAGLSDRSGTADSAEVPWQIILTTRRITPALEPYKTMTISSTATEMLLRKRRRFATR